MRNRQIDLIEVAEHQVQDVRRLAQQRDLDRDALVDVAENAERIAACVCQHARLGAGSADRQRVIAEAGIARGIAHRAIAEVEVAEHEHPVGVLQGVRDVAHLQSDGHHLVGDADDREGAARDRERLFERCLLGPFEVLRDRVHHVHDRRQDRLDQFVVNAADVDADVVECQFVQLQLGSIDFAAIGADAALDDDFGRHFRHNLEAADLQRLARRGIEHVAFQPDLNVESGPEVEGDQIAEVDLVEIDQPLERQIVDERDGAAGDDVARLAGHDLGAFVVVEELCANRRADHGGATLGGVDIAVRAQRDRFGLQAKHTQHRGRPLERTGIRRDPDLHLVGGGVVEQVEPALIETEADVDRVIELEVDIGALLDLQIEPGHTKIEIDRQRLVKDHRAEAERAHQIGILGRQRVARGILGDQFGLQVFDTRGREEVVHHVVDGAGQQIDRRGQRAVCLRRFGHHPQLFDHVVAEVVEERDTGPDRIADDRHLDVCQIVVEQLLHLVEDHIQTIQHRLGIIQEGQIVEIVQQSRKVGDDHLNPALVFRHRIAGVQLVQRELVCAERACLVGPIGVLGADQIQKIAVEQVAEGFVGLIKQRQRAAIIRDQCAIVLQSVQVGVQQPRVVAERQVDIEPDPEIEVDDVEERPRAVRRDVEQITQVVLVYMRVAVGINEREADPGRTTRLCSVGQLGGAVHDAHFQRADPQRDVQPAVDARRQRGRQPAFRGIEIDARRAHGAGQRQRLGDDNAALPLAARDEPERFGDVGIAQIGNGEIDGDRLLDPLDTELGCRKAIRQRDAGRFQLQRAALVDQRDDLVERLEGLRVCVETKRPALDRQFCKCRVHRRCELCLGVARRISRQ